MKRYAIFFPQFHHVHVNDIAWGHGFSDWVLVAMANAFDYWKRRSPLAGFYDLSKNEDVCAQFEAAAKAGLDGFGIYHYWFEDGPEIDAVERYLIHKSAPEGFGYFFIWANENWTKRWAGRDTEILKSVPSSPSRDQIRYHVKYLKPYMVSQSYTTVMNRPLFVIYRPEIFNNLVYTVKTYREEFERAGIKPLIGYCLKNALDAEYSNIFDFCYLFEPRLFFNSSGLRKTRFVHYAYRRLIHVMHYSRAEYWSEKVVRLLKRSASKTYPFSGFLEYFESPGRRGLIEKLDCPAQNVLSCGWNNAPRYRDRFTALEVPSAEEFARMLSLSLSDSCFSQDFPLLCNAWNEWSEGAAIEPCRYLGDSLLRSYLSQC